MTCKQCFHPSCTPAAPVTKCHQDQLNIGPRRLCNVETSILLAVAYLKPLLILLSTGFTIIREFCLCSHSGKVQSYTFT